MFTSTVALRPTEMFQLTLDSVQKELSQNNETVEILDIKAGDIEQTPLFKELIEIKNNEMPLARVYVQKGIAHVVYHPGGDSNFIEGGSGNIPLKQIILAVDSVLNTELKGEFTQLNKYLTVGVYGKGGYENHYVGVVVKGAEPETNEKDQIIVVNSKGAGTDPDIDYILNYLPEKVDKKNVVKIHTSQQFRLDTIKSGYYVGGNLARLVGKFSDAGNQILNKKKVETFLKNVNVDKIIASFTAKENKKLKIKQNKEIREATKIKSRDASEDSFIEVINNSQEKIDSKNVVKNTEIFFHNVLYKKQEVAKQTPITSLTQQRKRKREKALAKGIRQIYYAIQDLIEYDKQGIAVLNLTQKVIERNGWQRFFPKDMPENGLVIHVYRDKLAKQVLPIRTMIEGKIKSLCHAAAELYKKQESYETHKNEINKIQISLTLNFKSKFNGTDANKLDYIKLKEWMNDYIALTLQSLYLYETETKKNPGIKFKLFAKKVIQESTHHRVTNQDILIYDEDAKSFSYGHVYPGTATAHDREIGKPLSNLGTTFDGKFDKIKNNFKITSTVTHHASLVPIGSFSGKADKIDILMDTCNRIGETARYLGNLQYSNNVNWCYQLLTTNFWNDENQRTAYYYMAEAVDLMSDVTLHHNDGPIDLHMSLMNAGINKLAEGDPYYNIFYDEQIKQNRKAYLHLTNSLASLTIPESIKEHECINSIANLHDYLTLSVHEYLNEYEKCVKKIRTNSEKFHNLRHTYNDLKQKNSPLKKIKNEINIINKKSKKLNSELHKITKKIEDKRRTRWVLHQKENKNKKDYQSDIKKLLSVISNASTSNMSPEEILYLSSLYFKVYMDDLYYSGEYRNPEKAALFNAYASAYQVLIDMDPTMGCKSGIDRTFASCLVATGIQGGNLDSVELPKKYHENKEAYDKFKADIALIALSKSNLYTALYDTTSAPKVTSNKYKILSQERTKIALMPEDPSKRADNIFYLECTPKVYLLNGYNRYLRQHSQEHSSELFNTWLLSKGLSDNVSYMRLISDKNKKPSKLILYQKENGLWKETTVTENKEELKSLWKMVKKPISLKSFTIPIINPNLLMKPELDQLKPSIRYSMGKSDKYDITPEEPIFDFIWDKFKKAGSILTRKESEKIFAYADEQVHTRLSHANRLPTLIDPMYSFGDFASHKIKANKLNITENIKRTAVEIITTAKNADENTLELDPGYENIQNGDVTYEPYMRHTSQNKRKVLYESDDGNTEIQTNELRGERLIKEKNKDQNCDTIPKKPELQSASRRITSINLINEVLDVCKTDFEKIRMLEIFDQAINVNSRLKLSIYEKLCALHKNCPYPPLDSKFTLFIKERALRFLNYIVQHEPIPPKEGQANLYVDYACQLVKQLLRCKTWNDLNMIDINLELSGLQTQKNLLTILQHLQSDIQYKNSRNNPSREVANTPLTKLHTEIPENESEQNFTRKCAIVQMLGLSNKKIDHQLHEEFFLNHNLEEIEFARNANPACYYAQLYLCQLTLCSDKQEVDVAITDALTPYLDMYVSTDKDMINLSETLKLLVKNLSHTHGHTNHSILWHFQDKRVTFLNNVIKDINQWEKKQAQKLNS